ncbi:MAG: hypothetical protein ACXWIU_02330 [Limisphaerales bacterium]
MATRIYSDFGKVYDLCDEGLPEGDVNVDLSTLARWHSVMMEFNAVQKEMAETLEKQNP